MAGANPHILLSFAQFEREIVGERIRDKIAAQRRKGKWAGGVPILGYDVDRSNASPKLVINAEEAVQVRRIFSLYQEFGSLLPVVNEVNKRGWQNNVWKTKKGVTRREDVRQMLDLFVADQSLVRWSDSSQGFDSQG